MQNANSQITFQKVILLQKTSSHLQQSDVIATSLCLRFVKARNTALFRLVGTVPCHKL